MNDCACDKKSILQTTVELYKPINFEIKQIKHGQFNDEHVQITVKYSPTGSIRQ